VWVDTLTSIKVFRQVVESGTFVAAAERMDLSTAMVSKHVAHVEKRLGVRLLNRNTRTLSLTEPGRVYFDRCKTILDDLEATELELGAFGAAPRGTLRITGPSWFDGRRVADLLAQFRRRFPEVVLDVSFEDRRVDLVEEGCDVAMRVTAHPDSLPAGLIARPVRSIQFYMGGSREYLKHKGTPKVPEDLAHHDCIAVGSADTWILKGPKGKVEVTPQVVAHYRTISGGANAVAAGIGLGPLPAIFFEDPVFKDVLMPVMTEYPFREPTLYLVYVSRKYLPLKVRAFVDFILETVSKGRPSKVTRPVDSSQE
jgi:DNA-binding transcriptional LysR family regulator